MTEANEDSAVLQLQDILIGADSVEAFLDGLAAFAASTLTGLAGTGIECAVTLKRHRHTATVAGSSPRAVELDQIEQAIGDGPCIRALFTMAPELLDDVRTDERWPEYQKQLAKHDVYSTLGIPVDIGEGASAAINFFGPAPGLFTAELFDRAVEFGELASRTLHLSVRIGSAQARALNLEAAMQSRTAIDVACGVIMAQNRCSQKEAMDILAKVSSNRNQKLRDVAVELLGRLSGSGVETHFE
ncbi:GAF and ANTAR domain-containing protein [Arthrobacter sp. NPDC056493]|uniref:GAF and ANTAR domain-containing protein n=1 Tax=Arthrobacter sp. NPDC056493 TaxID=3345839 RepID=UPI003672793E